MKIVRLACRSAAAELANAPPPCLRDEAPLRPFPIAAPLPPSLSYKDKAAQTSSKTPAPVTSSHSMSRQARALGPLA
jgi:hypothetical protein